VSTDEVVQLLKYEVKDNPPAVRYQAAARMVVAAVPASCSSPPQVGLGRPQRPPRSAPIPIAMHANGLPCFPRGGGLVQLRRPRQGVKLRRPRQGVKRVLGQLATKEIEARPFGALPGVHPLPRRRRPLQPTPLQLGFERLAVELAVGRYRPELALQLLAIELRHSCPCRLRRHSLALFKHSRRKDEFRKRSTKHSNIARSRVDIAFQGCIQQISESARFFLGEIELHVTTPFGSRNLWR
jgi:hypothetical protein